MGGTTGRAPCRPPAPPLPASDQEGAAEDSPPKGPETTTTLDRLAQATGGTEKSWYRCVFPFGVISLVIGVAGTGVTFTFNNLPQTKVVSVVLLGVGLVLVLTAGVCWRVHKMKREKRKEGEFSSEQCPPL